MNLENYFRSLGNEVEALKNRVRDLKDSTQWLTDGEWKESVLRNVLRRNLPESVGVGNGFVCRRTPVVSPTGYPDLRSDRASSLPRWRSRVRNARRCSRNNRSQIQNNSQDA